MRVCRRPIQDSWLARIFARLTERVCYGIELDPKYVDVVIQRWQQLTGKEARLDGDGRTFAEIAHERRADSGDASQC